MVGFCGYLVFGLSVGLAYNQVVNNVPVFVREYLMSRAQSSAVLMVLFAVLYGLMQSSGNLGPGNMVRKIFSRKHEESDEKLILQT